MTITVGNTAPMVTVNSPPDGAIFQFGDSVPYQVTVTDPEDGTIDCSKVKVNFILGHDQHGHPITSATGCTGSCRPRPTASTARATTSSASSTPTYTDNGGLSGHSQTVLQPAHRQAEHFGDSSGNVRS